MIDTVLRRLMLGVFLASMEATIVSTALVNIVDDLQAFRDGAWVINAYLVAFTGKLTLAVTAVVA